MAKFQCVFIFGVVAAAIGVVMAITDEEKVKIRSDTIELLASCAEELGITKEEVLAAKQAKNPEALNPCYYRCFFKKIGTINDQGVYDPAVDKELHKKYFHNQDDLNKLNAISDTCASVNSQTVSDGTKGCERSMLLLKCFFENKDSFDPLSTVALH